MKDLGHTVGAEASSVDEGTQQPSPSVGDHFVYGYAGSYAASTKPIAKFSDKLVYTTSYRPGSFFQTRRAEIVFYGSVEACQRLAEQIKSSGVDRGREQRAAIERHNVRVEKLIAKALSR